MITFTTIKETKAFVLEKKKEKKSIGFVPTMGALHEGHLALMRRAKLENDLLVVSIFVNPIQFNKASDLEKYPRDLEKDIKKLIPAGCDVLFAPEVGEMYPEEVSEQYHFGLLESVMEGAYREGHFNGVAIVVKRLFEIVQANRAYFGEKDFQQLAIIQALVRMEHLDVEIIPCPIVRETDGLAMSSRNERLTGEERKIAPFIFQTLTAARDTYKNYTPEKLKKWVVSKFDHEPAFKLEYFEIADDKMLQSVHTWDEHTGTLGFIAVNLGNVRLIDNIRFI